MSTVTGYSLNGQPTQPFREANDVTISAVFGVEAQASINIDAVTFVDTNDKLSSQKVRELWQDRPTEGAPYSIQVTNGTTSFDFPFYLDYTRMKFLSDVETECGLTKDSSLQAFNFRAQGITMRLLELKNFLNLPDFQNVPYIVENRKTLLERIQLLFQGFTLLKSIADEVHKIINIASDLTSAGVLQAAINLTVTISAIIAQIAALKNLLEQIQDAFFPPVLYHSGIKPKVFFEKATEYMGYSGVEFGTLGAVMDQLTWLGSKNNQKGIPANIVNPLSGILNTTDVGFNLFDAKELIKEQFRCREAVIDNVYHLRPENDPFWVTSSGFTLPSVKVEQTFAENGFWRPNYEDVNSSTIIEYSTDDSDLWTLDDLKDESDPNSTGKIISVTTVEPLVVTDQRRVLLKGSKNVNIPYALAVRKDVLDDLIDLFLDVVGVFGTLRQQIEDRIDEFVDQLAISAPTLEEFITSIDNRTGALRVENHFFSVPKMMLLNEDDRIPANFADIIGARALYDNYHTWDSFIAGNRNPLDATQTAAKLVYEGVRIPFGLKDFTNVLNNSYFTTQDGDTGKFTKIDWNVRGDFAIVDYWVYDNWMTNIEENIS